MTPLTERLRGPAAGWRTSTHSTTARSPACLQVAPGRLINGEFIIDPQSDDTHDVLRLRGGAGELDDGGIVDGGTATNEPDGDVIDDWGRLSDLRGRRRSPALREVDRALSQWKDGGRGAPDNFDQNERELQDIIRAIDQWWATKQDRTSDRGTAIGNLGDRIRAELDVVRARQPNGPVVPSSRDLEIAKSLTDVGAAESISQEIDRVNRALSGAAASASSASVEALRQRHRNLTEDRSILQAIRRRTGWAGLRPPQIAALVLAERRGQAVAAREREELIGRLRSQEWAWTAHYPMADINTLIESVHDFLRRKTIVTVNVPYSKLDSILQDTRVALKNTWTVAPDQHWYLSTRGEVEEFLGYAASVKRNAEAGGIYRKARPASRAGSSDLTPVGPSRRFIPGDDDRIDLPKYAALVSPRRPEGGVMHRGNVAFHLKPAIRGRMTFTPKDSFMPGLAGAQGVTGPDHLWPLLVHGHEELIRLAFAEVTQFAYDPEMRRIEASENLGMRYNNKYFEAQVHRDVTWADIERVVIADNDAEKATEAADRLKRETSDNGYQIPVQVMVPQPARAQPGPSTVSAHEGLSSTELGRMVEETAGEADELAADEEQACLLLIRRFRQRRYPDGADGRRGVRSAVTVDDAVAVPDTANLRYLDLPRQDWGPVESWETLTQALARSDSPDGPVAVFVVTGRPGGKGHAVALIRTTGGDVWIADPRANTAGKRLRQATPQAMAEMGSPITARALTLNAHGQAIPPPTLIPTPQSASTFWSITDPADPRIGSGHGPPANTGNHPTSQTQQWLTTIHGERSGTSQPRPDAHTLQQIDNALLDWNAHADLYPTEPVLEIRKLLATEHAIGAHQLSDGDSLNSQGIRLLDEEIKQRRAIVEGWVRTRLQQIDPELAPYARRMPTAPITSMNAVHALIAPRDQLHRLPENSVRNFLRRSARAFEGRRREMQDMGVFVGPGVRDSQIQELVDQDRASRSKPIYPELSHYLRRRDWRALEDKATPLAMRQPYYVTIHGKGVWIDRESVDDESTAERLAAFTGALGLLLGAGYLLPDEIKLFLPKYGRRLTIDDRLNINIEGPGDRTYAEVMAPNGITIFPDVGKPLDHSVASRYTQLAVGTIVHELFHMWHAHISPTKFVDLQWAEFVDEVKAVIAEQVSPYAATSPREAVAEMATAIIAGGTNFPTELMGILEALV